MRLCGTFLGWGKLGGPKQRPEPDGMAREGVRSTLLAVDNADRRPALEAGLAERVNGLHDFAARGHDVLDEADGFARLEHALDPVSRPVLLRVLANDEERPLRRQ